MSQLSRNSGDANDNEKDLEHSIDSLQFSLDSLCNVPELSNSEVRKETIAKIEDLLSEMGSFAQTDPSFENQSSFPVIRSASSSCLNKTCSSEHRKLPSALSLPTINVLEDSVPRNTEGIYATANFNEYKNNGNNSSLLCFGEDFLGSQNQLSSKDMFSQSNSSRQNYYTDSACANTNAKFSKFIPDRPSTLSQSSSISSRYSYASFAQVYDSEETKEVGVKNASFKRNENSVFQNVDIFDEEDELGEVGSSVHLALSDTPSKNSKMNVFPYSDSLNNELSTLPMCIDHSDTSKALSSLPSRNLLDDNDYSTISNIFGWNTTRRSSTIEGDQIPVVTSTGDNSFPVFMERSSSFSDHFIRKETGAKSVLSDATTAYSDQVFEERRTRENFVTSISDDGKLVVEAANIIQLIIYLTSINDESFLDAFFLTYRSFLKSLRLADLLILRFESSLRQVTDKKDFKDVQFRTLSVIYYWLQFHKEDFTGEQNSEALGKITGFVQHIEPFVLPEQMETFKAIRSLCQSISLDKESTEDSFSCDNEPEFVSPNLVSLDKTGSSHRRLKARSHSVNNTHTESNPGKLESFSIDAGLNYSSWNSKITRRKSGRKDSDSIFSEGSPTNQTTKLLKRRTLNYSRKDSDIQIESIVNPTKLSKKKSFGKKDAGHSLTLLQMDSAEKQERLEKTLSGSSTFNIIRHSKSTSPSLSKNPKNKRIINPRPGALDTLNRLLSSPNRRNPDGYQNLLSASDYDIATELCLMAQEDFFKISVSELRALGWTKEDKKHLAQNINKMIDSFNKLSKWVASYILEKGISDEIRIKLLSRFIHLANLCYEYQNLQSGMAILLGLQMPQVSRLQRLWKKLSSADRRSFKLMEAFSSPLNNFSNLRKCINELDQDPNVVGVPFIGIYLADMVFNAESPEFVGDANLINFHKHTINASIIRHCTAFQNKSYDFVSSTNIRKMLGELESYDDEILWEISLSLVPRGSNKAAG